MFCFVMNIEFDSITITRYTKSLTNMISIFRYLAPDMPNSLVQHRCQTLLCLGHKNTGAKDGGVNSFDTINRSSYRQDSLEKEASVTHHM